MTKEQITAEILAQELLGNEVKTLQFADDIYIYVNGKLHIETELIEGGKTK